MNITQFEMNISKINKNDFPLTKQAYQIIKNKVKNNLKIIEILEHDGYDTDGPESNIYTLLIYNKDTKIIEYFTREYWYSSWKLDEEEYQLVKSFILDDFKKSYYYKYINYLL